MMGDSACKLGGDRYITTQTTAPAWVDSLHTFYFGVDVYASAINKNAAKFMFGAEYTTARDGGRDCYNGWEYTAAIRLNGTDKVRAYAMDLGESTEFGLNEEDKPSQMWACYVFGVCREIQKRGGKIGGFDTVFSGDVPLGAGMSSSAALESTFAFALNEFYNLGFEKFELARIGQSTEHNYCGVNCGIMDQFASVCGKAGHLMRLDCRSMEFEYFPFDPAKHGYRLVLVNSCVKHELVGSPYNDRRASCERVAKVLGQEFLRGASMEQLEAIKDQISEEDYMRARYVIGEEQRVLDVCAALEQGDLETVGARMYETHWGMSKDYEVSCEELDFLAEVAKECGVSG